jgi:hypothetical protein
MPHGPKTVFDGFVVVVVDGVSFYSTMVDQNVDLVVTGGGVDEGNDDDDDVVEMAHG